MIPSYLCDVWIGFARNAIQVFLNCGISGAPVLSTDGKLVGVLSESDVLAREAGNIMSMYLCFSPMNYLVTFSGNREVLKICPSPNWKVLKPDEQHSATNTYLVRAQLSYPYYLITAYNTQKS